MENEESDFRGPDGITGRMTFYDNEGKILTALHVDPCLITNELAALAEKSKEAERGSD